MQTYQGIVSLAGLKTGFVFLFMFLHHSTQFWKLVSQARMMKTDNYNAKEYKQLHLMESSLVIKILLHV